jgi:hypothetical protein
MASALTDHHGAAQAARSNAVPPQALAVSDRMWDDVAIEEVRWDQQFPYQLFLLRADGGAYSEVGSYTLPIPPQSISEDWPFAIEVGSTLGGVFEDHNGIPFRPITLQGTTGVLPARSAGDRLQSFNPAQAIFAGTIRAGSAAGATAAAAFGPSAREALNAVTDAEVAGDLAQTTGYYQFLLLKKFLESYAHLKKVKAGRPYRLALAIWKTGEILLVTPTSFSFSKDASAPHRWRYTLSLRAWKRVNLNLPQAQLSDAVPVLRDPSALAQLAQRIDGVRRALAQVRGALAAVRQDVDSSIFEPLRETALFAKDALGIPLAVADLPVNIIRDAKGPIVEAVGASTSVRDAATAIEGLPKRVRAEIQDFVDAASRLAATSGIAAATGAARAPSQFDPSPANKILEDPAANHAIFAEIKVGDLRLPPATTRAISAERERVRALGRADFEARRDALFQVQLDAADALGAGSAAYNAAAGRPAPPSVSAASDQQHAALAALLSACQELDRLAASGATDRPASNLFDFVGELARRSGIDYRSAASKRLVPLPYGSSLEALASRYLGDPDRWMEIAALNGLRAPYVDEEGFDLPLLSNGSNDEVVVADASQLSYGQLVSLSSTTTSGTQRRILGVIQVAPGQVVLKLDGDPDLSRFTVPGGSVVHAYLPGTVNSQQMVAIPDQEQPDEVDFDGKAVPGAGPTATLQVGGVDLLMTQAGDAAIAPDGDWRLAVGPAAAAQSLLAFIRTRRGSLLHAPGFGMAVPAGVSVADLSARDVAAGARELTSFNPSFAGVTAVAVSRAGPTTLVTLDAKLRGAPQRLPLSFEVQR